MINNTTRKWLKKIEFLFLVENTGHSKNKIQNYERKISIEPIYLF